MHALVEALIRAKRTRWDFAPDKPKPRSGQKPGKMTKAEADGAFMSTHRYRDDVKTLERRGLPLTDTAVKSVAWELGYEGEDYKRALAWYEPFTKVNLRREYDDGKSARESE